MFRTECAEFPNDNTELHDGAIWICTRTVGAAIVVRPDSRADSAPVEELRAEALAEPADWLDEAGPIAPAESVVVPIDPPMATETPLSIPVPMSFVDVPTEEGTPSSEAFSALILDSLTNGNSTDNEFSELAAQIDEPTEELIFSALEEAREAVAEEVPVAPLASGFFAVGSVDTGSDDDEEEGDFVVEELEALPPILDSEPENEPGVEAPPTPEKVSEQLCAVVPAQRSDGSSEHDPYMILIRAIENVALQKGRLIEAQAARSLLTGERVEGLSAEKVLALRSADILDDAGRASQKISIVANGWRLILRGESEDWSAVGASSLDEWAAEILSRLLENWPVGPLRKDLRDQGVAAFGLASAA